MNIEDFNYDKFTPMMKQYIEIKNKNKDAIVFFRLGDFYEMFFADAIVASKELEIALTARDAGQESRIPMCGIPFHAHQTYAEKLIQKGYKVAMVEQVEEVSKENPIVKRDVVRIYTPGTLTSLGLDSKKNNYLGSIRNFRKDFYLSICDVSTGELYIMTFEDYSELINEIVTQNIKEIIVDDTINKKHVDMLENHYQIMLTFSNNTELPPSFNNLIKGLENDDEIKTLALLLNYLFETQRTELTHLKDVTRYESKQYMKIDIHSKRNLELTETLRLNQKNGSLLFLIDKCDTAMGSRMLTRWLNHPLISKKEIVKRQDAVDAFMNNFIDSKEVENSLKTVYDLERILGRLVVGSANARDLVQLRKTLLSIPTIKESLKNFNNDVLNELENKIDPLNELCLKLQLSLVETPPIGIKEGGMIKPGYNEKLDELFELKENSNQWLIEFEQAQKEKTGIKNLKVGYNRVFGYYIEISKSNIGQLDLEGYDRKQTLANAERYITEELKHYEGLILNASDKIIQLEYEMFLDLRQQCLGFIKPLQQLADNLSTVDCLLNFSKISLKYNYNRPTMHDGLDVEIINGRHPVIEQLLTNEYVANDVIINDYNTILITGPNMSGKSTYMRMLALITILAQIGCFVPASTAKLPIFDQIFTRIGASDDLMSGQSTFMVEMQEANYAIQNATKSSLILFDEIGRGTATFDGLALAQAIVEHIHNKIGCAFLFSTHYHELVSLEENLKHLKNVHVHAKEEGNKIIFMHKVLDGPVDKSYGINVASLASLPKNIINRSKVLLKGFEENSTHIKLDNNIFDYEEEEKVEIPTELNEIYHELKETNIDNLTPIQCMNLLYNLKSKVK
ncbi:MAG: DNA mismatch repair protein MutS [bacterium]